jgi:tRNA A37 N6-isopentenylltransferase MiaA
LTLFDYLPLARAAIEDIFSRGKLPIIVGGTGLYVQGIVEGFELRIQKSEFRSQKFKSPVSPTACRGGKVNNFSRMELEAKTVPELNQILQEIDPRKAEKVDRKNAHRLIRAIEISQSGLIPTKIKPDFEVLQIGLDIPRNILHERIDRRVDERFESGMLEEVEGLINAGVSTEWLVGLGLEYRVMTEFLISQKSEVKSQKFNSEVDNLDTTAQLNLSLENNKTRSTSPLDKLEVNNEAMKQWSNEFSQMKQQLKFRIHQFARRQITWFRRFSEINWLKDLQEIKRYVKIFTEH